METPDLHSQLPNSSEQDFDTFLSSLPKEKGWWTNSLYNYGGFWYEDWMLKGVISRRQHFQVQDTDILLVTNPKCGTTWLKALLFTLVNRKRYPLTLNHPLFANNPHHLVPALEYDNFHDNKMPDISNLSSPRLLSSHSPLKSFTKSLFESKCKIVYLCRNPKDTFTSLWHFVKNTMSVENFEPIAVEEAFDMFYKGVHPYGPIWDHVLDAWQTSRQQPGKIYFLKYEEMKEQPVLHLKRLAEFLEISFSIDEEASGMVEEILKFCSIDNMKSIEVNKSGMYDVIENRTFFRKGEVGDWKNCLTTKMAEQIDQLTEQKFQGTGLRL